MTEITLKDVMEVTNQNVFVFKALSDGLPFKAFTDSYRLFLVFPTAEVIITATGDKAIVELDRTVPYDGTTKRLSQSVSFYVEHFRSISDVAIARGGEPNLSLVAEIRERLASDGQRHRRSHTGRRSGSRGFRAVYSSAPQ
ncbi:MAG: hypothetical protein JHC26_11855 [Thermofilum sp.]|jgi:hypothetical protein|uniref:hypothetical protein n=1 Tax=Thermofilum sp. TaxID=1961369 RepID=UPI002586A9CF|nr:hypothetical protein [Thermofilum sp.]MCI4409778.1 hypothetical protein [Thermofilum sp.]